MLSACGSGTNPKIEKNKIDYSGDYVTPDYAQRDKGYDWVSVNIVQVDELNIKIQVRSRTDIKKPTCTLDATANKLSDGTYKAELTGGTVLFEFKDGNLNIKPMAEKDEAAVHFYCSGGASLAGSYSKTTVQ